MSATPIPDPLRRRVAALVASVGERRTSARLGISRHTLARVVGGLSVYAGTHAIIRQRLDALDAELARQGWRS